MAKVVVVTGGSRSGKSAYAQRFAEGVAPPRTYIATATVTDEEMRARIRRHQADREKALWKTVEEPLDLAGAIGAAGESGVILVDCLTLWVNNLLYESEKRGACLTEEEMREKCRQVLAVCGGVCGTVIFVTNEVGMGVVPGDALSRRFRDVAGRCNQVMAEGADAVVFMVSGLPLLLKGERLL